MKFQGSLFCLYVYYFVLLFDKPFATNYTWHDKILEKNKLELTSKSDTLVKISVKGICPMKKHGHYCKVCDEYKANEKFSGKGHTAHICKKCAALPPDVRSAQMIENKLLSLPWRLSKEQIKWLNNKAHDKRPEIRKLAQEQLDMRFHPERLASDDADEFEDLLLNKDDEDEDEW